MKVAPPAVDLAWLADRFGVGWGWARRDVHLARALDDMPQTARAFADGELSESAVRVLVASRDEDPEAFRDSEPRLVEAARIHSMGDVKNVVAYWRQAVERERGLGGQEKIRERRRLHASVTFMGMVRVDGDLDPETGETFLTALRAVLDADARAPADGEIRTPAQRRADALGEICRQWLDLSERPAVGGEKPHVTVTLGAEALSDEEGEGAGTMASGGVPRDGLGGTVVQPLVRSELDHVGPVPAAVGRRLACDAQIRRVVLAGASEPLDVGRRTPVVPPAMRRAVIVRDRHCRFPGCDRPHTWCDTHHVVHWADGGPTALPNLLLLCRRHHGMVHGRGGFTLAMEDRRPVFRRPDGTVLEERGPPRGRSATVAGGSRPRAALASYQR